MTYTPEYLASVLKKDGREIRQYLRDNHTRPANEKGKHWKLNYFQANDVLSNFGMKEEEIIKWLDEFEDTEEWEREIEEDFEWRKKNHDRIMAGPTPPDSKKEETTNLSWLTILFALVWLFYLIISN